MTLCARLNRCRALLLLMLLAATAGAAAMDEHDENLLKAAFVFNFARFTVWPESVRPAEGGELTLCVTGDDTLAAVLPSLSGRKIRRSPVYIRHFDGAVPAACHLLYVARSAWQVAPRLLESVRERPVLSISQQAPFIGQGGIILMYRDNGHIRFRINLAASREAGLKLSSRLLRLADIQGGDGG